MTKQSSKDAADPTHPPEAASRERPDLGRLLRYMLVGCANTLIGLSVIFLGMALGLSPVPANAVGYAVGLIASYLLNRRFTFRSRVPLGPGALRYAAVVTCGYALNLAILLAALHVLSINAYIAQTLGVGAYFIAVYAGSSLFVFNDTDLRQDGG
ncbi:MAG: GtrA family protein [Rhizobiaceae bacterium]|nr:GtrA family protein [Rhizobiaceae bacterium]